MAYAGVISLKQTIKGLVNSSRISLISPTREILESAYNQTTSLQKVLERLNDSSSSSSSEGLGALDGQIRDAAHILEDFLEFHESFHLYSQEQNQEDEGASHTLSLEVGDVRQEITSFAETARKMEKDYIQELSRPVQEDSDDAAVSSIYDFGVEMVGHSSEFSDIRHHLLGRMRPNDLCFFSLLGEVGSGRTFVAKTLFEDLRKGKTQFFDCCAWVTLGTKYQVKEVVVRILAQLDNLASDYEMLIPREDEKICSYLNKTLKPRRYLIMLDDVRDVKLLDYLRSSLPDQNNGSLVLLTTSSKEVCQLADKVYSFELPRPYFEETMLLCLRIVSFGFESTISPELEEQGKKIAENCQCLLISAAKTLLFLYKTEKSVEQWSKIAADKQNPIFMVEDEISEIHKIKTEMESYSLDMDEATAEIISTRVHFYSYVEDLKRNMHPERFFSKMQIISLFGMAGIGKSTFARRVCSDYSIYYHFDHRVWVTLGPKYQAGQILIDILAQIYPSIDKMQMKEDEKLARDLCVKLSSKRCLIVLDDLWSKEPLHHLKKLFPDINGTAFVTTRLAKVAKLGRDDIDWEIPLLDKEKSWCLLREKVFAEVVCSPKLEKAGRKIAENCEGLPLLILTVAEQLLKVEITPEYWNDVASGDQKSLVFKNAHEKISKALLPGYESLPQHLKPCFLYMGVFRNKYKIPTSKLTNLWVAEGFLEPNPPQMVEDFVAECLSELVERSLVMVQRKASDAQIKKCSLHSVFWHLSSSVAVKNKFFHAMNSYADCSVESIKSQRRLCIRNSILLGIKDVHTAMESSKSRALLCTGPPHKYPVPLYFGSKLLRVLDALAIRFYKFPVEVVELIHLRYLALTCNGELPTSISNLWKLQHFIVSRYINTVSPENSSPLPVEIWDMKELKHLQIMGGYLPNPKCATGLLKLSTLLEVSAQSCTKKVLEMMPNLKRLGIRIELAPDDDQGNGDLFHCLNCISRLRRLESLKCVVLNPDMGPEVVAPPAPVSMFPSSLKRLSLSGFGYPWEYMSTIGKLENLQVLKLKHYAFQGPKWDMDYTSSLNKLKFLLVEDTDLVHWEAKSPIFTKLERLSIAHCYELQELPLSFPSHRLKKIEIVDCDRLAVSWAEQMRGILGAACDVEANLSWNAKVMSKNEN